jgi:DHA1 family multidrug resistance protein-like MFS transporter
VTDTPTPPDGGDPFAVLLTICCAVTFVCYFAVSMRLPVVPLYAKGFGVTTAQIGVINAGFYLMAGLLAVPSGALSDLVGRKRMAVGGSVVLCIGMLLLLLGRSYWQLTGIYLLLGVGIAAFGPTMMTWVSEISPASHLGRAYGWYTTALFCGLGLGPAAGGAMGAGVGYAAVFLTGAALVVLNTVALQWLLPAGGKKQPPATGDHRRSGQWRAVLSNHPLIGCWSASLGANVIAGVFFTFLPLLAHHRGLSVDQIGVVFLVQSVTNALSRIPFGVFSDTFGRRHLQALAGILLVTLAIAGFAPAKTFLHFLLAAFGLGVSLAVAFTSIGALIAETATPASRGLAMGGYNSCIYFGLMAGSMGIGPLIEAVGFGRGFLLTGLINIPFIGVYVWGMRRLGADSTAG